MSNIFKVNGTSNFIALILSVALSLGVGVLAGFFSMNSMQQYMELNQPTFAPPGWVFAPVWTALYLLMGIAAYRIWMYKDLRIHTGRIKKSTAIGRSVNSALTWYLVQLTLNFLWTIVFFTLQQRGLAFFVILLLLISILITTIKFYKIDKPAGLLMVPYILWVSFATYLNYSIWMLNKT